MMPGFSASGGTFLFNKQTKKITADVQKASTEY